MAHPYDDSKREALAKAGTLNSLPERVSDGLFQANPFFDARDTVQVKYELLRRVRVDGQSVSGAASSFGVSRPTYYEAKEAFERAGFVGLLPAKKGPRRSHKLSAEVLAFARALLAEARALKPKALAEAIRQRFDVTVHPKSVARALLHEKKTATRSLSP